MSAPAQAFRVPPGWVPEPGRPGSYVPGWLARRRVEALRLVPPVDDDAQRLPWRPRPRLVCSCNRDPGTCRACALGARIDAAARAVKRAREDFEDLVRARNQMVVLAVDAGMSQKQAAQLVEVSQPHVNRILTRSQPDASRRRPG